jgi:hypothetical protein
MLTEGAFAHFHENPTSLLPISHAATIPVANGNVGTLPDHKTV